MSITKENTPHLVVGVDVGGTFTDLFVLDEKEYLSFHLRFIIDDMVV
jgi:N-methylhydantoinase A/oxoprolinase/acetone carboxylase beta subunit